LLWLEAIEKNFNYFGNSWRSNKQQTTGRQGTDFVVLSPIPETASFSQNPQINQFLPLTRRNQSVSWVSLIRS
jgi:hypothetical protein